MLNVEHISYAIRHKTLLNDLSLAAHAGSLTAVVGGNGAGKSTFIKLLSGEHSLRFGALSWEGKALGKYTPQDLAKKRAVLTQKVSMSVNFSVEEVVMMGRYPHFESYPASVDYQVVERAMEDFSLTHLAKRACQQLSGGEQQRVHLARIFSQIERQDNASTFLLLDEPLNNLDVRHQFAFLEHLRAYVAKGNVAILVIHDLNLAAQFADQVVLLREGHLLASGSPADVFTKEHLSEAYQYPVSVFHSPEVEHPLIQFGAVAFPTLNSTQTTQTTQTTQIA